MDNCVFCKIVRGDIPSYKVYEDDHFLAFIDINPQSSGQVQVVPKEHYRWVWDVPNVGDYFEVARKIALAQKKAFDTDEVFAKVVGEEVPHAHIWVFQNPHTDTRDKKDFAAHQKVLKENMLVGVLLRVTRTLRGERYCTRLGTL